MTDTMCLTETDGARRGVAVSARPLTHLERLEAESIHAIREVAAERERPVMLYSNFTGVDAPYEPPEAPEVRTDTTRVTPEQGAALIMRELRRRDVVPGDSAC